VLGVCALFNKGAGEFELARMAVAEEARGLGYGSILIDTCLSKLKSINASKVYLVSNIKLEPAINLYKKHGFKTTSLGQHPVYARANIVMEAKLTSDEESS
jgi:ribosomal protein S18 acetylase RimI-like enzyme